MKYSQFKIPDNSPAVRICNAAAVYCKIKHAHTARTRGVVKGQWHQRPILTIIRIYMPTTIWHLIITIAAIIPQPFAPDLDLNFFIPCRYSPSKIIVVAIAIKKEYPQFPRRHLAKFVPIIRRHFIRNASLCNSIYGIRRNGTFSIKLVPTTTIRSIKLNCPDRDRRRRHCRRHQYGACF